MQSKKIGIFSKFHITGGSEMRCVELCNAISQYTPHQPFLLGEGDIAPRLKNHISPKVEVCPNVFLPQPTSLEKLYEMDCILIVNTDSKAFTTLDYWTGKSEKHQNFVDLTRINQMIFLFNFLISPAKKLPELEMYCPRIKIITTNTKFFDEVAEKQAQVIHLPRIILESPIHPDTITQTKTPSKKIRLGMHSRPQKDKWNSEWSELIQEVNNIVGKDKIEWIFLGAPDGFKSKNTSLADNVTCHKEFSIPVKEYLESLDVFVFFTSYKREEPWSRVVAEAMASGCPAIANTKGGNADQIIHGNNGFLCEGFDDFVNYSVYLCKNPHLLKTMKNISIKRSRNFLSESIANKLIDFIDW